MFFSPLGLNFFMKLQLVKAVAYEERRRIRAQIRLVKKQLEDEHNRNGNRIPLATPTKTKVSLWQIERLVSALLNFNCLESQLHIMCNPH